VAVVGLGCGLLAVAVWVQQTLDQRRDPVLAKIEDLAHLPKGEYLKPTLLGYHHLASDILWLRTIQVLGKGANTAKEYDWLYHALDVITTLDPQYDFIYRVAGITMTELANRPELSNRLLEKGLAAVPQRWDIPYLMAYNYYFYLGDVERAAHYARLAAQAPDGPPWLLNMATQMSAHAGNPEFALQMLRRLYEQQNDPRIKESLEQHIKEVIIERDIRSLEPVVARFYASEHRYPAQLSELVTKGYLPGVPPEPFGGSYLIEEETGRISSSAHVGRLRMYREPGSGWPRIRGSYRDE
jgi:tetratricopeptide (TPR) repeat protein